MLATLGGSLALLLGLGILLLPLLATELSRPRDSFWGAVVLLLGLVLVTTTERLTGAPMLAVLCGGLLIGRLGSEVGLARWRQLTPEEQLRLGSSERWRSSLAQLGASCAQLLQLATRALGGAGAWIAERRQPRSTTKRWVRPEVAAPSPPPLGEEGLREETGAAAETQLVSSFEEIDVLLGQTRAEPASEAAAPVVDVVDVVEVEDVAAETPAESTDGPPKEPAGIEAGEAGAEEAG
jgi:hypothetical protein